MGSDKEKKRQTDGNQPMSGTTTPQPPDPTFKDYHNLARAVTTLGLQAGLVEENQRAIGRGFEALTKRIESLATQNVPSGPKSSARFKEPRVFNGSATDVEPFLEEIQSAIELSRSSLITERDKTLYFSTFLGNGSPKSWFSSIKLNADYLLDDLDDFIGAFRAHFGDSDIMGTCLRKIEHLKQMGACSVYASKFRELLVHVDFSEATKIQKFYEGLKEEVKDLFVSVKDPPTIFDDYVDLAISIDNRVHRRTIERQNQKKSTTAHPKPTTSHNNQSQSAPNPPQFEPMQIDAAKVRRGPLSPEERERRHREGLCAYCGGKHDIGSCPNMSPKAKKSFAER